MNASKFTCAAVAALLSIASASAEEKTTKPTPGTKAITQINTGTGLTGGPITTTGTISVATGGITSSLIADGTIAAADVNPNNIQLRVSAPCAPGFAVVSVEATGNVACQPLGRFLTAVGTSGSRTPSVVHTQVAGVVQSQPIVAYVNATTSKLEVIRCADTGCSAIASTNGPDSTATSVSEVKAVGVAAGATIAYRATVSGVSQIRITVCGNASCSTSTSSLVENNSQAGTSIGLAIGADTFPILSYYSDLNQLRVAKCGNASCSTSTKTTVDATTGAGIDSDIKVRSTGLPTIAYGNGTDLKLAQCGNTSCSSGTTISTLASSIAPFDVQLALAPGDNELVVFGRGISPMSTQAYSAAIGVVSTLESGYGSDYSLVIGSDGAPIVSYRYVADNVVGAIVNDIRVARCNSTLCNTGATITSVRAGLGMDATSISIGTDGLPVVAFDNDATTDNIGFNKCGSPTCF